MACAWRATLETTWPDSERSSRWPGLVEDLVEPLRAEHAQRRRLREVRDQHVGEAGPQPVDARVAGHVLEVEHRQRAAAVLGGGRRAALQEDDGHREQHDDQRAHGERPRPATAAARRDQALAPGGRAQHQVAGVDVALQVLEVAAQVGRGLVAVLGTLLERALDHARERARDVVAQLAHRPRRVLEDRGQHRQVGAAAERPLARRHLVEQDPEREDVRAVVDGQPLRLLRRHVGDRPDDASVLGDRLRLAQRAVAHDAVVAQLGEAEVEHLEPAVGREHHVLGLQVAVQDALAVRRGDGVAEQRSRATGSARSRSRAAGSPC